MGFGTGVLFLSIGSYKTTVGFMDEDPNHFDFPTVVGRKRHTVVGMAQKNSYVGNMAIAESKRGVLTVNRPVEHGIITNWDDAEEIIAHSFYEILRVSPEEHPVMILHNHFSSTQNLEKIVQTLFEVFDVPALCVMDASAIAIYNLDNNNSTGLIVDIGDSMIKIVSVYEGHPIHYASETIQFGGRDLTDYLMKMLAERGYSFTYDAEWNEIDIVRDIKNMMCYVSLDFVQDMEKFGTSSEFDKGFAIPGGLVIDIGNEMIRCTECLFSPSFLGKEDMGIVHAIFSSVSKCPEDLRSRMYENICLIGGSSQFKGLSERIKKELLANFVPKDTKVNIKKLNENADYYGAFNLATTEESFLERFITKQMYDLYGPTFIHRWWS